MKFITRVEAFERMSKKGHKIFENDSRNYNLNIIGIRSKSAKLDEFGCQLMIAWKYKGEWNDISFRITTYPGEYYLVQRLLNPKGCAILCPGQYPNIYTVRKHNNKYNALCQTLGPVKVFRDRNKNRIFELDPKTTQSGSFGINIHNSPDKKTTLRVGFHSAGCQVFSDDKEFDLFMSYLYKSLEIYGNKFTYTLIEE